MATRMSRSLLVNRPRASRYANQPKTIPDAPRVMVPGALKNHAKSPEHTVIMSPEVTQVDVDSM